MASDEDYASFLDKANQDLGAESKSTPAAKTKSSDGDVPESLKKLDVYYVSEADEPFEGVSLSWAGGSLNADSFKDLLGHEGEVEELSVKDFDPRGDYGEVVDAVKKAVEGDVKVFRVVTGASRVEYFVIGVDGKGGRIVGLKAKAVES